MITVSNYKESTKAVDFAKMPNAIQEGHKFMTEFAELYNDDADIKKAIDNHVKMLNENLAKKKDDIFIKEHIIIAKPPKHEFVEPKKEINPKSEQKLKKEKSPKQRKPKYKTGDKLHWYDNDTYRTERIERIDYKSDGEPLYKVVGSRSNPFWQYSESEITDSIKRKVMYLNQPAPKDVHHLDTEVRFIKRYAALNGKVKTRDELLAFLHSLQKAINDKTITKKSQYATEIIAIQQGLVNAINICRGEIRINIDEDNLHKYQSIASGQKVIYSIPIIKNFIMLSGKSQVKAKAEALLKRIQESIKKGLFKSDPHGESIKNIKSAIEDFIAGKQERLILADISLRGLYGIAGIEPPTVNLTPGLVMSSSDFVHIPLESIVLDGGWKKLIGTPSKPFKIMFSGGPGSGKSSLVLKLGHYLCAKHNEKALMISKEEGLVYTLQEKVIRLKTEHPNFKITGEFQNDLSPYSVVILDSVNTLGIEPEQLRELYKKYPKINWILIFQITKDGKHKGKQEYEHDVDAHFYCEDLIAYQTGKNRFGGKESIKIV